MLKSTLLLGLGTCAALSLLFAFFDKRERQERAARAQVEAQLKAVTDRLTRVEAAAPRDRTRARRPANSGAGFDSAPDPQAQLAKARAYVERLEKAASAEPIDSAWAQPLELALSRAFLQFSDSHVLRVECHKTLCSLQARHANQGAYQRWLTVYQTAVPGVSRRTTFREIKADGSIVTRTVLVKDGQNFPELS